jgi:hypothetical protein
MIACDESDDGDITAIESEDFGIKNKVLRMFVVCTWADVRTDLMKDGGHLEKE